MGCAQELCSSADPKACLQRGTNIRDTELSDCRKWKGPHSVKPVGGHAESCSGTWNPLAALWEGLTEDSSVRMVSLLCVRQAVQLLVWMGLQRQGCGNWMASQNPQSPIFMCSLIIFFRGPPPPRCQISVDGGIHI